MKGVSFLKQAAAEKSSLSRSFWYGRFLQALPSGSLEACYQELQTGAEAARTAQAADAGSGCPRLDPITDGGAASCKLLSSQVVFGKTLLQHVGDALECLSTHETSLSPTVSALITTSVPRSQDGEVGGALADVLLQDCTLNWPTLAEYFKDIVTERKDYSAGVRKCGELARRVYRQVSQVEPARLRDVLEQNFSWTPSPTMLSECIRLLGTDDPLRNHISLLINSAMLERALGDVYLTVSKAAHCPSLLRDLLATEELERTFNPTAMCLLRCLIGPPSGLNLRNVLWHGFAAHHEIPEEYAYLLLVVTSSLGKQLADSDSGVGAGGVVVHRPYVSFPQEGLVAGAFKDISDSELAAAEQLFSHSYFILPSMLPTWRAAIHALREKKYSHFMVLILPALEHALRRIFACANSCPERVLTAESTTLYTTLDEILSPVLPNGESNLLKEEIGVAKMEMLLDLLVHPKGPRLRDRISHGEVDFHCLSRTFSVHLLCVCVTFCAQYALREEIKQVPLVARCLAAELEHVSLFHPISLLRRELQQLVSCLDAWSDIPSPSHWEEIKTDPHLFDPSSFISAVQQSLEYLMPHSRPDCLTTVEHVRQLFHSGHPTSSAPLLGLLSQVWGQPLPTLHTARGDLELTEVLRRTVESASAAVVQVKETATLRYHQWEQKQLRSRQRGNYDRLLASLQTYRAAVKLLVVLLAVTVSHIPLDPSICIRVIRFHKKVLQFSENFSSQTHPSRNRWEEAQTLCHSFAGLAAQTPFMKVADTHTQQKRHRSGLGLRV